MNSIYQMLNFLNTDIQHACETAVTLSLITNKYLLQFTLSSQNWSYDLNCERLLFKLQLIFLC